MTKTKLGVRYERRYGTYRIIVTINGVDFCTDIYEEKNAIKLTISTAKALGIL